MTIEYLILRHDIIESAGILCKFLQVDGLKNTGHLARAATALKHGDRREALRHMLEVVRPEVNIKSPVVLLSFGLN